MASGNDWDAEKMLDLYLHDYLVKNNMHETAAIFKLESGISDHSVVINAPQGFLREWWSIFYDNFASRQLHQPYSEAETSAKDEKVENQSHPILPESMVNQQRPEQAYVPSFDQSSRSHEAKQPKLASSLAASSSLLQGQINLTQHQVKRDHGQGISLEKTIPVKSSTPCGKEKAVLPVTGRHAAGLKKSVNPVPPFDAQNYQDLFQMLNSQLAISAQGVSYLPESMKPTFPGSSAGLSHDLMPPKAETDDNKKITAATKRKLSKAKLPDKKLDSTNAVENKPDDDTIRSFLSDDENVDNTSVSFRCLRRRSSSTNKNEHKGFTFGEVGCFHSNINKVLCCHFSTDGRFLACAGHEKKVLIWNTETFDFARSSECHSHLITDICFKPNSTIFATSSFDKTVQIWDSAKPGKSLFSLVGHADQVLSLDFHPRKVDLLCSCDSNNEMRLWNVNQRSCKHVSKGATRQVRFQPRLGKLIATASENVVNVIDVETDKPQLCLKGHDKEVLSICWDPSGKYIASVSEDSARVWSVSGGECFYELRSTGNKFQCCTFHPGYSQLLIIGGYQSLELWHPIESNKTLSIEAHRGLISSLAYCQQTETIASTSHDHCVKLWK